MLNWKKVQLYIAIYLTRLSDFRALALPNTDHGLRPDALAHSIGTTEQTTTNITTIMTAKQQLKFNEHQPSSSTNHVILIHLHAKAYL